MKRLSLRRRGAAGERYTTVRRRLVLLTGVVSSVFAIALMLVVQFVVSGQSSDLVHIAEKDRAAAIVNSIQGASQGTSALSVPPGSVGSDAAVYDSTGDQVAGSFAPSLTGAFERMSTVTEPSVLKSNEDTEKYSIYAEPFALDNGESGVVVVALPLSPYRHDQYLAIGVSIFAAVLLITLTVVMAAWVSRRALDPVEAMARTAEAWSERDLAQRFNLGPPTDEIRALGHTLDSLLDKVAVAIRAEQRLTSELAHELRSPLTAILATTELIELRNDLDEELRADIVDVHKAARAMSSTITVLLELARREESTADVDCLSTQVCEQLRQQFGGKDIVILNSIEELVIAAPPNIAVRALAPVVENGVRISQAVRLDVRREGRFAEFRISDDGPGVADELADALFEPGSSIGGSGLGLPLARRVARSIGGEVRLEPGLVGSGAVFVVSLPCR